MNIKYALAMGAGFALGAAVIQGLHAQARPPAYYIAEITLNDQEAFIKEFAVPGMKPLQEAGAKFLARGGKPIYLTRRAACPARHCYSIRQHG
jgi:hypothetical protein